MPSYFCKAQKQYGDFPSCDGNCIRVVQLVKREGNNVSVDDQFELKPCACLGVFIPVDELETALSDIKRKAEEYPTE